MPVESLAKLKVVELVLRRDQNCLGAYPRNTLVFAGFSQSEIAEVEKLTGVTLKGRVKGRPGFVAYDAEGKPAAGFFHNTQITTLKYEIYEDKAAGIEGVVLATITYAKNHVHSTYGHSIPVVVQILGAPAFPRIEIGSEIRQHIIDEVNKRYDFELASQATV